MCMTTRVATMGGQVGMLGGDVGRIGGLIGILVDGNARECTAQAARSRDAQAMPLANAVADCIKTRGGKAGNAESERYFFATHGGVSYNNGGVFYSNGGNTYVSGGALNNGRTSYNNWVAFNDNGGASDTYAFRG